MDNIWISTGYWIISGFKLDLLDISTLMDNMIWISTGYWIISGFTG